MFASISYTDLDVSPELRQAEIELHRHIHSLLSDAWKQNALLSKQLLGARNELDAAHIQIERLTCDLEAERMNRTDAEAMCQDLQDRLSDVTSERDMFTYQSEALIAARAALAQDLLAIDSSSEEEPEECTDSDSDHLGFRPESVSAERDEMIDGLQELLLARAALADVLLAADESLVIEEHSLDSLPVVHEDSEVLAFGCAAGAPRAEKRTRFADLIDVVVIGEEEEEEEIAPPSYDESNDDSDISFSCSVEDNEMSLCSFVDSPPCFTSSDDDMSMCSFVDTLSYFMASSDDRETSSSDVSYSKFDGRLRCDTVIRT